LLLLLLLLLVYILEFVGENPRLRRGEVRLACS